VNLIKQVIRPGNFCLDIGANIGAHTLLMARVAGSTGRVIALEPHPRIYHRLLQNTCLNRLTNVKVVNAALADKDGTIDLYGFAADAFEQGISSVLPDHEANMKIEVRAIRGATLIREQRIDACDFIKIDVKAPRVWCSANSGPHQRASTDRSAEYRKQHWEIGPMSARFEPAQSGAL
jgi:FkbM family methyltransferase